MQSSVRRAPSEIQLKFVREQGFFDRSQTLRWFITGIFTLGLFCFLHFREARVEVLELDSRAERYLVAQVDFEFHDEEKTAILREAAAHDIGTVFQIDDQEVQKARLAFENYLIRNQEWRQIAEHSTFEEMYEAVDALEDVLLKARFTDPRTLQRSRDKHVTAVNYHIFTPSSSGISVSIPKEVWDRIERVAFAEQIFQLGTVEFVMNFFKGRSWTVVEDSQAGLWLRNQVRQQVKDHFTWVPAGSRIIDQGEKVTSRHIQMLQAMKLAISEERMLWSPVTLVGSALMTLVLLGIAAAYFRTYHRGMLRSNRMLLLILSVIGLGLGIAKLTELAIVSTTASRVAEVLRYPILVPFPAILLCSLVSPTIATVASGYLTVILTMTMAVEWNGFMIINLVAAMVAIVSTRSLRQRKEVFAVCGKAWLGCFLVLLSSHLYSNTWSDFSLVTDMVGALIFMTLTAISVVGILPLFESSFHIMTDVSLMEYMDPNNEILRRLSIEAPGTYQHSVVVGNLAESAALSIGANGLFCRVSCLYHDIGKLVTPHYFTENQHGGMNMHQLLTPLESAQVIMAHVSEGVAMARKIGLPEQFIDVIKEHHGTTAVYYFYHKQVEDLGGDPQLVDEKDFRYSGPKPCSKESAIIMIADSFEAASRSLDEVNEESLTALINQLVQQKAQDGQFDECQLTFEELGVVKRVMVKTLVAAGHARVKYPEKRGTGSENT